MNRIKQLILSHPKKALLLAFLLSLTVSIKKRHRILSFTFNQVLSRMNEKLISQVSEQVTNVENYNLRLSSFNSIQEEYYPSIKQILKAAQNIENIKQHIKQLDQSRLDYNSRRTIKFTEINIQLILYVVSTLCLHKYFLSLNYLASIISLNSKNSVELLLSICKYIQNNYYNQLEKFVIHQITTNPEFSYQQMFTFGDAFKLIVSLTQSVPCNYNKEAVEIFCASEIKYKYNQLLQSTNEEQDLLDEFKGKCEEVSKQLLEVVEGPSLKGYRKFSTYFSINKLWNRVGIHKLQIKQINEKLPLLSHLTLIHQIIENEFLHVDADISNDNLYKARLKQSFRISSNQEQVTAETMSLLININEEYIQSKLLKQALQEMGRKLIFLNDEAQKDENDEDTSMDLSNLLLQISQ